MIYRKLLQNENFSIWIGGLGSLGLPGYAPEVQQDLDVLLVVQIIKVKQAIPFPETDFFLVDDTIYIKRTYICIQQI